MFCPSGVGPWPWLSDLLHGPGQALAAAGVDWQENGGPRDLLAVPAPGPGSQGGHHQMQPSQPLWALAWTLQEAPNCPLQWWSHKQKQIFSAPLCAGHHASGAPQPDLWVRPGPPGVKTGLNLRVRDSCAQVTLQSVGERKSVGWGFRCSWIFALPCPPLPFSCSSRVARPSGQGLGLKIFFQ